MKKEIRKQEVEAVKEQDLEQVNGGVSTGTQRHVGESLGSGVSSEQKTLDQTVASYTRF